MKCEHCLTSVNLQDEISLTHHLQIQFGRGTQQDNDVGATGEDGKKERKKNTTKRGLDVCETMHFTKYLVFMRICFCLSMGINNNNFKKAKNK